MNLFLEYSNTTHQIFQHALTSLLNFRSPNYVIKYVIEKIVINIRIIRTFEKCILPIIKVMSV